MHFIKISHIEKHYKKLLMVLSLFASALFIIASYLIVYAPDDYLQGILAKIMYIHVPCAWFGLALYCLLGFAALGFIIFKNPIYDIIAYSAAPIGITFTLITLITGSIWGKPTWGAWWVWDARLTSMLVLFFIYFGYLALRTAYSDENKSAVTSSIFAIIGLINIPIIKFSVHLWNTLHQGSSFFGSKGLMIDNSMLIPLIAAVLFFVFFTCIIMTLRILNITYRRQFLRQNLIGR